MNRVAGALWSDVRYSLRGLRNAPGYAVTLLLTLTLGLGSVTAMLAIVHSVLLRPVALPHSEQLVMLYPRNREGAPYNISFRQTGEFGRESHLFSDVAGYNVMARPVTTADGTRMALQTTVTPNLFRTLGIRARYGRLLRDGDNTDSLAVVNASFWRERLRADPKAIGSTIKISEKLRTVVGVLPDGFKFPQGIEGPLVFTPAVLNGKGEDELFGDAAQVIGRMKPGVSLPQAREEARSLFAHIDPTNASRGNTMVVISYRSYLTGDTAGALWALLGGCFAMLLIACANAANLQIARATGRLAEMGVRSALGATFGRLMQQLATESILISLLGSALGACLAYALVAAARKAYGGQFSRFDELAVRPAVVAACAFLALAIGCLASLAPVLQVRRQTLASAAARRTVTGRSRIPGVLVGLQIALTCVLLVTCGLFLRTFRALEDVPLGFDPHHVTTLVLTPENQHQDPEISRQKEVRLLDRFSALPGVQSAAMQTSLPFSSWNVTLNGTTDVSGRKYQEGDSAFYSFVSTDFVHASGIHLRKGRAFESGDGAGSELVALVNDAFVKKFLFGRDPLDARIKFHRNPTDTDADMPFLGSARVVGVVENEVQGQDLGAELQPMVYMDLRQLPRTSMLAPVFSMSAEYAIRSTLPAAALAQELRTAVKQTAPDMAEMNLQSMEDGIANSLSQRRLALQLASGFGAVALLLAAVGLYGVLTYAVAQRRKEIGIRMALGSSRAGATGLVVRHAGRMVAWGVSLGGAALWPAGRAVRSFLFGVKVLDPSTLASAGGVLLFICVIAATVPAWRAAQVNPMEALRAE